MTRSKHSFGSALAQDTCESKAVDRSGKVLAGAAKTSFMKKCQKDACQTKAVDKNGKALAGAARMLNLSTDLGFEVAASPTDTSQVRVTKALQTDASH